MSSQSHDHNDQRKETLSASVTLAPMIRQGAPPPTSADVSSRLPDTTQVEAIRRAFEELGFGVGDAYAATFSITAERSVFEQVFSSWPKQRFSQEWLATASEDDLELPVGDVRDRLGDLVDSVAAIYFTARPDFGPGNP